MLFSSSDRVSALYSIAIGMVKQAFGQVDPSSVYVMDLTTLKTGSYIDGIGNIEWME